MNTSNEGLLVWLALSVAEPEQTTEASLQIHRWGLSPAPSNFSRRVELGAIPPPDVRYIVRQEDTSLCLLRNGEVLLQATIEPGRDGRFTKIAGELIEFLAKGTYGTYRVRMRPQNGMIY